MRKRYSTLLHSFWIPAFVGMTMGFSAVVAPTASAEAQSSNAVALFEQARDRIAAAKSLRVTFQQTLSNPLLGNSSTAKGELVRKQPNLFSITFSEPNTGDRIVSDGKHLWLYVPTSAPGQVIKSQLSKKPQMLADPFTQVLTASSDDYSVTAAGKTTLGTTTAYGAVLQAKKSNGLFTKAVVWLDGSASVQRVDITEPSGVQRTITILSLESNVSIPASRFVFTPPPKTRIIEQ